MKPFIFIYCEGTDMKLAVFTKEKDSLKLHKAASLDVLQPSFNMEEGLSNLQIEGDEFKLDNIDPATNINVSAPAVINSELGNIPLSNSQFIPALTEPAIYYHVFEGAKDAKGAKLTQEIVTDIRETKNVTIDKENLGYTELADDSILSVFLSGDVQCIKLINSLAHFNGKRFYKIPAVKSAELSLAYYIAKRKKFFPDDQSLIVYIGKEYSKLIFLQGRKLKHIGSTLDIGTINLHTYDVYFSKILLEMENGGVTALDNIIVCGEDDSENLILSFYGTFPEANVTKIDFDEIDTSSIPSETASLISSFTVPIAAATDYFDELDGIHKGINLLPKYVKEEQKTFQFAWHGYAILPLLFLATLYFTVLFLSNNREINVLDEQIEYQTVLMRENQERLNQIAEIETKIATFDQTQAILDSAAVGTGVWTNVLSHISDFIATKKNIWITRLSTETQESRVVLEGYTLNKSSLTDFAYSLQSAELKGVFFEELRDKNSYKFTMTFTYSGYKTDI